MKLIILFAHLMTIFVSASAFAENELYNHYLERLPQIQSLHNQYQGTRIKMLSDTSPARWTDLDYLLSLYERHVMDAYKDLVRDYSWGIPSEAALDAIAEQGPVIEIGAGKGYWASLLQSRGVDIIAYDSFAWRTSRGGRPWFPVESITPDVVAANSDRALLLVWPPQSNMAYETVSTYTGDTVIYVGEFGGRSYNIDHFTEGRVLFHQLSTTANRLFFNYMRAHFRLKTTASVPNWPGYRDRLYVFKRKRTRHPSLSVATTETKVTTELDPSPIKKSRWPRWSRISGAIGLKKVAPDSSK